MAVTISIGRNIKGEPMSDSDWADFKDAVLHVLYNGYNPTIYFEGAGIGNGDWGAEDTWTVIAADALSLEAEDLLKYRLGVTGKVYGQEAVAVTFGVTHFV